MTRNRFATLRSRLSPTPAESRPIARCLEIVGERWTLLIVRDAFYGVRRFSDCQSHRGIPKAVLADRLAFLVEQRVLTKEAGGVSVDRQGQAAMAAHLVDDQLGQRELSGEAQQTDLPARAVRWPHRARLSVSAL